MQINKLTHVHKSVGKIMHTHTHKAQNTHADRRPHLSINNKRSDCLRCFPWQVLLRSNERKGQQLVHHFHVIKYSDLFIHPRRTRTLVRRSLTFSWGETYLPRELMCIHCETSLLQNKSLSSSASKQKHNYQIGKTVITGISLLQTKSCQPNIKLLIFTNNTLIALSEERRRKDEIGYETRMKRQYFCRLDSTKIIYKHLVLSLSLVPVFFKLPLLCK